jgi:hypothetical protein
MKTLPALLSTLMLTTAAFAVPAVRVTNTEYDDGSGSSKELDPEKRQSIETFFDASRRPMYRILYQLDDRLKPVAGIYYNNKNRVFQKSSYTLDGADRIIQEVVFDPKDTLVCTKNFYYGTRGGQSALLKVVTYDRNGTMVKEQKVNSVRRVR